jgi:phosphoglycolate phosphatase
MDWIQKIRGFVFDFDGTLALLNIDFGAMRQDILKLAEGFGLNAEPLQPMPVLEMVESIRASLALKECALGDTFFCEAHRMIKERELRAARCGGLHASTVPLLRQLGREGFCRGIITRNCEEAVRIVFPQVEDYCEAFFPRDRVRNVKPHPEHLSAALACMGVEPECAAMVGDHPIDVQCGKAQGLITIGVLTGNADRDRLEAAGALIVLGHVGELLSLLPG